MDIAWQKVLPVVVSIGIIILIAVLREYSRTFAAVAAVMPINLPLGLWIVYAAEQGEREAVMEFADGVMIGMAPTLLYLAVTWLAVRAGWSLVPVIIAGYAVWAIGLGIVFLLRQMIGAA